MKSKTKYKLAKKGGKIFREHFERSAFEGTPTVLDKIGTKITEPIFNKASYAMVGALGYKSKSNPAKGSLAYTIVHALLKFLVSLIWDLPVSIIKGIGRFIVKIFK